MATVVGVQFQKNGKAYTYDVNNLELKPGDYVIAETTHGIELGEVIISAREYEEEESAPSLKQILRHATEKDLQTSADNRKKEREAYCICQKKIAEHKLDMKLVSVEYAFDNSKALFYFTANGRVDFRSLVKDLASVFKMRIELRQIGVRDEARMIGGLGPCGRQICCGAFLDEFQPVSIKMAKEQNLSLNPTKISGVCGRLMCCLKYEQDHYEQTRKIMPKVGKEVVTPDGTGTVSDLNIVKETVFVRITNGDSSEIKEYSLDKIEKILAASPVSPADKQEKPVTCPNQFTCSDKEVHRNAPESQRSDNKQTDKENRIVRGSHNGTGKNKEIRKQPSAEQTRQNPALGKPVMRENPNKTKSETTKSESQKAEASISGSSSNWAEAVRKAIDSIN